MASILRIEGMFCRFDDRDRMIITVDKPMQEKLTRAGVRIKDECIVGLSKSTTKEMLSSCVGRPIAVYVTPKKYKYYAQGKTIEGVRLLLNSIIE